MAVWKIKERNELVRANQHESLGTQGLNGGGRSWIRECISNEIQFPKFNSIMEMCSGPGFMGYHLAMKYGINDIHLVDIYEPNREVIEKTNSENNLEEKISKINNSGVDAIFVGGSLILDNNCEKRVELIKSISKVPVIFFPGGISQLNKHYDAMLFMSILSGRNFV